MLQRLLTFPENYFWVFYRFVWFQILIIALHCPSLSFIVSFLRFLFNWKRSTFNVVSFRFVSFFFFVFRSLVFCKQSSLTTLASKLFQLSPRMIDAPLLEDESCVEVACGARHSAVLTGILKWPFLIFNIGSSNDGEIHQISLCWLGMLNWTYLTLQRCQLRYSVHLELALNQRNIYVLSLGSGKIFAWGWNKYGQVC